MTELTTCTLSIEGPVATVTIIAPKALSGGTSDLHWELGHVFSQLRGDNSVRIVVLTGSHGEFYVPREKSFYERPAARTYVTEPAGSWMTFTGVVRTHEAMAQIEKPIVAKVNGNAIGFGSSLVFACDLIVAAEDAFLIDMHLGMGEIEEGGPAFGIMPGDGGAALLPLFMSPALAKEYLMLAKRFTAAELAADRVINYAVPAAELDAKVDDIVARLLKRPSYALAWTKRVANRRVLDALNMGLDAGAAYEMVNFLHLDRLGWKDPDQL